MHKHFLKFLDSLNIDNSLLEAIVGGYTAIFQENVNGWGIDNVPYMGVNAPMGSYQNIMKQIPSSIGAVGGAGDNTRDGNNEYKYGDALPDSHRDMKDETINEWEDAPEFPKFKKKSSSFIQNKISGARDHIPIGGEQMYAPMPYHTNFHLGRYDVDTPRPPF